MTATAGRASSLRFKLFLLLAGPLLVALARVKPSRLAHTRPATSRAGISLPHRR